MVVSTPTPVLLNEKIRSDIELPIIDFMAERSEVSKLILKACEVYGFFKLINHGIPQDVISQMEGQSWNFFSKPSTEKEREGPPNPYGYGCKNIGFNGDIGEVEYLLLKANPHHATSQPITSNDSINFRSAKNNYVETVKGLACKILEVIGEELKLSDTYIFSKLIKNVENDSLIRLNHYPPSLISSMDNSDMSSPPPFDHQHHQNNKIGFGEHTDPQILTILKSNSVDGLQISVEEGVWIPVTPHPTAFFVNVGDVLQAMTNGRLMSVKHRAVVNSYESRMSMAYFASPPLSATISPIREMVTSPNPRLYRSFTWAEFKKAMYSRRLGDCRLNLFKLQQPDD